MSSGFTLSLIILAVAAASLYFLLQANGGVEQLPELIEKGWVSFQANNN